MRRLKVGVIGLGVGEQHIEAYLAHPSCEVVSACDLSADKLEALGARHPELRLTRSDDDILRNPDIDLVSIASYDDHHFTQVVKALDSGKHVFVEKPLCRTLEELTGIKQALSRNQGRVKLVSNLILRAAPVYVWLKEQIAAGEFGEIYAFDGDYLYGRLHKITDGWRNEVVDYSVMEGGGIHLIDLMIWLTGQRPVSVFAAGNRISTRDTKFRYDDYVSANIQCSSGMIARITANFGCVHRHQHVVRVFGTRATFIYDDAGPRVHESRDPENAPRPVLLPALAPSKGELIGPFVDAILEDREIDTQSHFDVISIASACDDSLRAGALSEVRYV